MDKPSVCECLGARVARNKPCPAGWIPCCEVTGAVAGGHGGRADLHFSQASTAPCDLAASWAEPPASGQQSVKPPPAEQPSTERCGTPGGSPGISSGAGGTISACGNRSHLQGREHTAEEQPALWRLTVKLSEIPGNRRTGLQTTKRNVTETGAAPFRGASPDPTHQYKTAAARLRSWEPRWVSASAGVSNVMLSQRSKSNFRLHEPRGGSTPLCAGHRTGQGPRGVPEGPGRESKLPERRLQERALRWEEETEEGLTGILGSGDSICCDSTPRQAQV